MQRQQSCTLDHDDRDTIQITSNVHSVFLPFTVAVSGLETTAFPSSSWSAWKESTVASDAECPEGNVYTSYKL